MAAGARNLAADPRAVVHTESREEVLIVVWKWTGHGFVAGHTTVMG